MLKTPNFGPMNAHVKEALEALSPFKLVGKPVEERR
jgi:hypothetical protein